MNVNEKFILNVMEETHPFCPWFIDEDVQLGKII